MNDIEVIFFDLFYTLIVPSYNNVRNEYDVIGITRDEWEIHAEDNELYILRATGNVNNPLMIIENILDKIGIDIYESNKKEILKLREERFRDAITNIDSKILDVLLNIKKKGKKICLISNADVIDVKYWYESPLNDLFDEVIFSYEVGFIKPQKEIYEIALKRMNVKPENSLFVGDGGSDELKGARTIGMNTMLTSHFLEIDTAQLDKLEEFADFHVKDIRKIMEVV